MMIVIMQAEFELTRDRSTRDAMISAAVALVERRGVSASGLQDIMAEAAAPRGSIYHHFPGGKDELVAAALDRVADEVVRAIGAVAERSGTPAAFVSGVARVFRTGAEQAAWTKGCPLAATAIEGDRQGETVRDALSRGFHAWRTAIAEGLIRSGSKGPVEEEALMVLSALEGGLLLSRGSRSAAPYDAAVSMLGRAFRSTQED